MAAGSSSRAEGAKLAPAPYNHKSNEINILCWKTEYSYCHENLSRQNNFRRSLHKEPRRPGTVRARRGRGEVDVAALNYRHLHYFWAVAKAGSIARASERLHV